MDLPVKNVIFDADDQKNVMLIYEVIKKIVEERDYTNVIYVAADITEELLKKNKYYSTISARTILRWSSVKSVNKIIVFKSSFQFPFLEMLFSLK